MTTNKMRRRPEKTRQPALQRAVDKVLPELIAAVFVTTPKECSAMLQTLMPTTRRGIARKVSEEVSDSVVRALRQFPLDFDLLR